MQRNFNEPRNLNTKKAKTQNSSANKSENKAFDQMSHTQNKLYKDMKNSKSRQSVNANYTSQSQSAQNNSANSGYYSANKPPVSKQRTIKRPMQGNAYMPQGSAYSNENYVVRPNQSRNSINVQNAKRVSANVTSGANAGIRPKRKGKAKKKSALKIFASILLCLVLVFGAVAAGLYFYAGSIINEGEMGTVTEEIKTPPQLAKDQLSVLVLGIDNTEFDAEGAEVQRSEIGNTDMILYVRFDFANNSMYMLQIPRDLFVGDYDVSGSGKLNSLFSSGSSENESRIDNIAVPISEMLQLPIDNYVTIDMVSLREIVDVFGGIEVYVPEEMGYEGSSYIPQGWQTLHGDMLEFFLRDRSGATGDIARLDTQRYFYSALFRRLRTATWQDIVKLMPVAQQYVNTDISVLDAAALAINVLKIPSSNIMMCTLPTFDSTERYNVNHAVQVADVNGVAELLNTYFRTPEAQVPPEAYNLPDWPHSDTPHDANVQFMDVVDAQGGGSVGVSAQDVQTGDDLLQPPDTSGSDALEVQAGTQ